MSAYGHTGGSPGPLTGCGKTLYGRKDVPGHEFTRPALACRGCRKSFRMCWALERFHNYCIRYRGRAGLQACVKMQDKWASAPVLRGIHQFWNCYRVCGKTLWAKKMHRRLVWHSAASRNAIDASLATHGGSPGLQAGESFLRIGLQPWSADPLKIVAKRKEFRT